MKKYFKPFVVLLCALFIGQSAIYAEQNSQNEKARLGIRAVFSETTSHTVTELSGFGPGFSAGLNGYIPFGKYTYFNVGFLFGFENVKLDGIAGTENFPVHFDGRITSIGFRVPLDLGFKMVQTPAIKFSIYTGPHFFINTSVRGNYKMKNPANGVVYRDHDGKSLDNFYGMEIDWGVGLALDVFTHWHIHVEGNYGLSRFASMEKVYPDRMVNFKRTEIAVGLGYNF